MQDFNHLPVQRCYPAMLPNLLGGTNHLEKILKEVGGEVWHQDLSKDCEIILSKCRDYIFKLNNLK